MYVKQPAKIFILTRLGIGVFDRRWWHARLSLFKATALPSLARFRDLDIEWVILLDKDMDPSVYAQLRAAVDEAGARSMVRYQFVNDQSAITSASYGAIKAAAAPDEPLIMLNMDDDDAVGSTFFTNAFEFISPVPYAPQVITFPKGRAFDAPNNRIGELYYESLLCNTVFFGKPFEIAKLVFKAHTEWIKIAPSRGFSPTVVNERSESYMYTYHSQGDGDYDKRVGAIASWAPLEPGTADHFGISLNYLDEWEKVQSELPPTLGLTWRRTQVEQHRLAQLSKQAETIKREAIRTNRDIFDPGTPFFYLLYPLPGETRPEGPIAFHGVGTPKSQIELWATGKSGTFNRMSTASCDENSGGFGLRARFSAGEWTLRLVQKLPDQVEPAKTLEFKMAVTSPQSR